MTLKCTMILGDCLDVLPSLIGRDFSLCFADLPYAIDGNTYTKNTWDRCFPLPGLMNKIKQCLSNKWVFSATCSDRLAASFVEVLGGDFRYTLVWVKNRSSLYFHANNRPLCRHELVQIGSSAGAIYNPQMAAGKPYTHKQVNSAQSQTLHQTSRLPTANTGTRYPDSVIFIPIDTSHRKGVHPTQKPMALLDWLIRTYSGPGDHVLDPTSGSGTTAVAALQNGRHVTCIEKDPVYFYQSVDRVKRHCRDRLIRANIEVRT